VGEHTARARAFELIQRDHIRSDKLGPLCQRDSYGFCKEYETFLRAVLAKNPHKNVQATACLSLGHFLNNRLQRLDLCQEQQARKQADDIAAMPKVAEQQLEETRKMAGKVGMGVGAAMFGP
jgi:hypothetical protein